MISATIGANVGTLAVVLLAQSSLLIAIGLAAARLFRRRGSAVTSAIYRTTLVAVLACPIASGLLVTAGAPGIAFPAPQVAEPVATASQVPVVLEQTSNGAFSFELDTVASTSTPPTTMEQPNNAKPLRADIPVVDERPGLVARESVAAVESVPSETSVPFGSFASLATVGVVVWLFVSSVLLARLAAGQISLWRLRRRACPAEAETTSRLVALADRIGVQPPLVLRSPFVSSPCLFGLLRPTILLPGSNEPGGEGASDILLHELAHLVRRDCFWNWLAAVVTTVLSFQPLLWILRRRIITTAEEVCDDHVIAFGFDRCEYAQNLTQIAEQFQPPIAAGAVAVAAFKSAVGRRVTRILDSSRTRSTRAGVRVSVVIGMIAIALTLLVGLVGSSGQVAESEHASTPSELEPAAYLGPSCVVASADGKTLYVTAADARRITVVDANGGAVLQSIAMPADPTGLVLSPDGATLYVTCAAPEGTVAVVDVESGKSRETIAVGHWPIGPAISPDGETLYVCNRFDNNVASIHLPTKKMTLVPTTREPYAAVCTPDGKSVFVINHLPLDQADAYDVATTVTVIDTATNETETIRMLNGATGMRGICVSPDGRHVFVTHLLSRYQMPTTQLERGWMNTNALTILDAREKKRINTVVLDDIDLGAANPRGVAMTADGESICVTHAGAHELSVIDADAIFEKLGKLPPNEEAAKANPDQYADRGVYSSATAEDVPNDLAFLHGLRRRVPLTAVNGPRGLAVVGSKAYVAGYFTDNLAVVDLNPPPDDAEVSNLVSTIALGPPPELSEERRGQMLFNDATFCFQQWQSCGSCHPDARVDGLNWDLMNDGMGNPKNVRSMLLADKTPPSMSSGVVSDASEAVRSQISHLLFSVRPDKDIAAIEAYLKSLEPVASPYLVDGELSPAAQRGKELFFNLFFDGKLNCANCHPAPLFTDMQTRDVGSKGQYDRRDTFDTPTLVECWRTAPYMHDGRYTTIKQLLTEGKHGRQLLVESEQGLRGEINIPLTERQVDDLAEYVLSIGAGERGPEGIKNTEPREVGRIEARLEFPKFLPYSGAQREGETEQTPPDSGWIRVTSIRAHTLDPETSQWKIHGEIRPNASGVCVFENVPAGYVSLSPIFGEDLSLPAITLPAEVAPGATTKVSFGGEGRPVVGKVDLSEVPEIDRQWIRARISLDAPQLSHASGDPMNTRSWKLHRGLPEAHRKQGPVVIDAQGRFRFDAVPPGNYRLQLYLPDELRLVGGQPFLESRQFRVPLASGQTPIDLGAILVRR